MTSFLLYIPNMDPNFTRMESNEFFIFFFFLLFSFSAFLLKYSFIWEEFEKIILKVVLIKLKKKKLIVEIINKTSEEKCLAGIYIFIYKWRKKKIIKFQRLSIYPFFFPSKCFIHMQSNGIFFFLNKLAKKYIFMAFNTAIKIVISISQIIGCFYYYLNLELLQKKLSV